jgi:hypothetical protein
MKRHRQLLLVAVAALLSRWCVAQEVPVPAPAPSTAPPQPAWEYSLTTDGYIVPQGQSYVSPVFTADHQWLHLEARYNYEAQRTASLWGGYNFSFGKKVQFSATPMIGGVFGEMNGIAPGLELSISYKKLSFTTSSEYVIDTDRTSDSYFYSWPELTYSIFDWLKVGGVAQRTKAFQTSAEVQHGFLVGISHKQWEFTTYVFNPELDQPAVVLEVGVSF